MRKLLSMTLLGLMIVVLAACNTGDEDANHNQDNNDELDFLEVDFEVPETATAGQVVELKATVTFGDEPVSDADEVQFEIWPVEDEDDSESIDGTNHEDGTYTIEYTFDEPGDYEMYAHTTAHDMHTMPKKKITITE